METSNAASDAALSLEERSTLMASWKSERFDPSVTQNTDMPDDTFDRLDQTMEAALGVLQANRKSQDKNPDVGPWAAETIDFVTLILNDIHTRIESGASSTTNIDETQWKALNMKRNKLIRQFEQGPERKPKTGTSRQSTVPPVTQPPLDDFVAKPMSRSSTSKSHSSSVSQPPFLRTFGQFFTLKLASKSKARSPSESKPKPKQKPEPEPEPEKPKATKRGHWKRDSKKVKPSTETPPKK